jgi:hypothetical protein
VTEKMSIPIGRKQMARKALAEMKELKAHLLLI